MLGVDPTKADDDFKITRFWMEGGKPMFEFSHSTDGTGNSFTPRIKTKGGGEGARRADACAPFGFGFAESTLRFASAHFPAFSADSQALNTAHLENRLFQLPKGENQCLSLYLSGANAFCHSKNG